MAIVIIGWLGWGCGKRGVGDSLVGVEKCQRCYAMLGNFFSGMSDLVGASPRSGAGSCKGLSDVKVED